MQLVVRPDYRTLALATSGAGGVPRCDLPIVWVSARARPWGNDTDRVRWVSQIGWGSWWPRRVAAYRIRL